MLEKIAVGPYHAIFYLRKYWKSEKVANSKNIMIVYTSMYQQQRDKKKMKSFSQKIEYSIEAKYIIKLDYSLYGTF